RAGVVFEHVEIVAVDADDINAGDVDIDVLAELVADHLRPEKGVAVDEIGRNDTGLEDRSRSVKIGQEHVERTHALLEAAGKMRPFGLGENPRDDIEGDNPFFGVGVAIDGEGDADPAEQELGFGAAMTEDVRRDAVEPALEELVAGPAVPVREDHFIKGAWHLTFGAVRKPAIILD